MQLNTGTSTPLSYFDDKPIGRMLSRFSQDLFVVDSELPNAFGNFVGLGTEMAVLSVIIIVAGECFYERVKADIDLRTQISPVRWNRSWIHHTHVHCHSAFLYSQ